MDTRVVALDSDVIFALFRAEQYGFPNGLDAIVGEGRLIAITSTVRAEVAALPTLHPETDGRIDAWIEKQKLLGNLKVYNTPDFLPHENRGEQSILSALSRMQSDGSGGAVQVFSNDANARAFFDASPLADTFDTQTGLLVSWTEGALTIEEYYSLSVAVTPEAGPPRFEPFSGEVWNSSDGHSVRILPTGQILVVDAAGRTFVVESNEHVRFNPDGTISRPDGTGIDENGCFGGEVPIDMWPLDPDLKPGPDGIYDQDDVRSKIWKKPIELIRAGDIVVSFDDNDNLVPGPVTETFQHEAKILLSFHGTRVTPGHVYFRPDSKKSYKYETLIDVLRDDGVIKHQDGTLIRAAINVPVGSPRDGFVRAVAGKRNTDGTFEQTDEGRIRLGTRFLVGTSEERKSFAVADLIEHNGGVVGEDELIHVGDGPGVALIWDFGDKLPKPEDFVLACSGTTLEDIYKAAQWESQGPRLPAPMVLDRGPVQPLKGAALSAMPRNEPLNVAHAPMASAKPQRTLNRKQRKAMEAKQRKAAKAGKRVAV